MRQRFTRFLSVWIPDNANNTVRNETLSHRRLRITEAGVIAVPAICGAENECDKKRIHMYIIGTLCLRKFYKLFFQRSTKQTSTLQQTEQKSARLIARIETVTSQHNMLSRTIHLCFVLWGKKTEEEVVVFMLHSYLWQYRTRQVYLM